MAPADRTNSGPPQDSADRTARPTGGREDPLVVLVGVVITAATLYDVYRRQVRARRTEEASHGPGREQ